MSVANQIGSYDNQIIAVMAHAMAIAHEQAIDEGRIEEIEMAQVRLARVIMALVQNGGRDPEILARAALERLSAHASME